MTWGQCLNLQSTFYQQKRANRDPAWNRVNFDDVDEGSIRQSASQVTRCQIPSLPIALLIALIEKSVLSGIIKSSWEVFSSAAAACPFCLSDSTPIPSPTHVQTMRVSDCEGIPTCAHQCTCMCMKQHLSLIIELIS